MRKYLITQKWCPLCSTVNDIEDTKCLNCNSTNLGMMPYSHDHLEKFYEALSGYIAVADFAYSNLIVNDEITRETEMYMPVMAMNYAIALELGMKTELLSNGKEFTETHSLEKLFKELDPQRQGDVVKHFDYFKESRDKYSFNKALSKIDQLFTRIRYVLFDAKKSGYNPFDFDIEFLKDMATYFSKPQTIYCHTILCKQAEKDRDCENCPYVPKGFHTNE